MLSDYWLDMARAHPLERAPTVKDIHMKNFFKYHRAQTLALALAATMLLPGAVTHAQISKANQILINRGLQVEGLVATYDTFNLSTYSNANYTAVMLAVGFAAVV